ncbi:MAG: hypothetical protein ACXW30_01265 [Micavibrio sp.]
MAYIRKIVGADEKLIGIARLHWIYLIKGLLYLAACAFFAWALNALLFYGLSVLAGMLGQSASLLPLVALTTYLMPFMLSIGTIIFLFHLCKMLSTEIGLTSRRVIRKDGLIFVRVNEVDLEEIRGQNLDLGWFGRFLGYGYLNLDCRFIGDVKLPAIEKPERFLKALHKATADISDSLAKVMGYNSPDGASAPQEAGPSPAAEATILQQQQQIEIQQQQIQQIQKQQQQALPPRQPPAAPQIVQPIVVNHVDAEIVAQVVDQVVPQMVEKITEEIAAKNLAPDAEPPAPKLDDIEAELLSSFDEASTPPPSNAEADTAQPAPA